MQLRDYQARCHDAIFEAWQTYVSVLAELATGCGKTVIFAHVIRSMQPKRAIVLVHREELIWQAREKIEAITGLPAEVEMAGYYAHHTLWHKTPIVLATVQSMIAGKVAPRMRRFKPEDFGVLIIDECHHSTANSYRRIIDYFKQNAQLRVLGVTATPKRADEEALNQVFEKAVFQMSVQSAVEQGWLVDVTQQYIGVKSLDFSHIHTTAGDLNLGELSQLMEQEENIQGVCQPSLEVMYGMEPGTLSQIVPDKWGEHIAALNKRPRRTIVFTASVLQAETLSNIFNRVMPELSHWICGKTPKETRRDILGDFSSGKVGVVCNCGVLTEGFDNPQVEVIIMARPTKSLALYTQMLGRSTRPLPGVVDGLPTAEERRLAIGLSAKPFCRIVDFVGNSGRHHLVTAIDVLGGKVSEKARQMAIQSAIKGGKPVRVMRTLEKHELEVEKKKREQAEWAKRLQESKRKRFVARVQYYRQMVNPFDRYNQGPELNMGYRDNGGKPLSPRMREILANRGFNPDKYGFKQALAIIGKIAEKEHWKKKGTT